MKIVLFANTDWYLFNFRRSLALALQSSGHDVLLISPPGDYGHRLIELGLRWEPIPMVRSSLNPLREVLLVMRLARVFSEHRVDVVHGFTIKCAVYGSIAARLAGVRARINAVAGMGYVFTSNDFRARFLRPVVRGLLRLALGGPNVRLILQNPDDVELFKAASLIDPRHVRLIQGSGVDCSRFAVREKVREDGPLRVLLAARLLWDKGVAEYVEAARLLLGKGRAIRFLLAGTADRGNPAAVPESMVHEWVRAGLVEWLGHIDDMPELLSQIDIMVLPSYREGLPKTLIEAAACALPLVTTDVPGCREVVTDEKDGLLVPVRDANALAVAIARLQDDPALRLKLGAAARAKALTLFDEKIVIKRTIAVYSEIAPAAAQQL